MINLLFAIGDIIKALFVDFGSFITECFRSLADILALTIKTNDLLCNILLYFPSELRPLLLSFIALLFCVLIVKLISLISSLIPG